MKKSGWRAGSSAELGEKWKAYSSFKLLGFCELTALKAPVASLFDAKRLRIEHKKAP